MTIQKRLQEAVEQKQLRPLDAQFALAVAGNDNPPLRWRRRCSAVKQARGTSAYRFRGYRRARR